MSRDPLWLEQLRRALAGERGRIPLELRVAACRLGVTPDQLIADLSALNFSIHRPGARHCDHTHCRSEHRREVANGQRGQAAIEFHEQLVRCRMQGGRP